MQILYKLAFIMGMLLPMIVYVSPKRGKIAYEKDCTVSKYIDIYGDEWIKIECPEKVWK